MRVLLATIAVLALASAQYCDELPEHTIVVGDTDATRVRAEIPCDPGFVAFQVDISEIYDFEDGVRFDMSFVSTDSSDTVREWRYGNCEDGDANGVGGLFTRKDSGFWDPPTNDEPKTFPPFGWINKDDGFGPTYRLVLVTTRLDDGEIDECPGGEQNLTVRISGTAYGIVTRLGAIGIWIVSSIPVIFIVGYYGYIACAIGYSQLKTDKDKSRLTDLMTTAKSNPSFGKGPSKRKGGSASTRGSKGSRGSRKGGNTFFTEDSSASLLSKGEDDPFPAEFHTPQFATLADFTVDPIAEPPANIQTLLIVVNERELVGVLNHVSPLPGVQNLVRTRVGQLMYYFGTMGKIRVGITQTPMGLVAMQTTVFQALRYFQDTKLVVNVGVAFGIGPERGQKFGDILVSNAIIPYEEQRISANSNEKRNSPISAFSGHKIFELSAASFSAAHPTSKKGVTVRVGPMLSGSKLIDNKEFRDSLIKQWPKTVGGEMEGVGLAAAAASLDVEWVVVKAVSDFADGKKAKSWQPWAAWTASLFVCHALQKEGDAILKDKKKAKKGLFG